MMTKEYWKKFAEEVKKHEFSAFEMGLLAGLSTKYNFDGCMEDKQSKQDKERKTKTA